MVSPPWGRIDPTQENPQNPEDQVLAAACQMRFTRQVLCRNSGGFFTLES